MTIVAIVDLAQPEASRYLAKALGECWGTDNGVDDDGNGAIDDVHGLDTFTPAGLTARLPIAEIRRGMARMYWDCCGLGAKAS